VKTLTRSIVAGWVSLGPHFLPFADAASAELPLSRLLRLALFQVSVGMALVLLVGTLNRVMIVELNVPAALVAVMLALPLLYAPFRALIGHRSDTHHCSLGWRRVPFIWMGTLLQFGGLAIMPFALLVLSGGGEATQHPSWLGQAGAAAAFLLVGAGLHTTQTAGLALATDLAPVERQPKVVGLMYVMLLVGTIVSALLFGWLLAEFSPARLVQVIQGAAVATLVINSVALWKQERIVIGGAPRPVRPDPTFREAWQHYRQSRGALVRLAAIGLGTLAFAMQDVLLEPYGGHVLGMSVGQTTWLTAALAFGGLFGFGLASAVLSRGFDPARMAGAGAWVGLPAFGAVIVASALHSVPLFVLGALLIGLGGGLFGHGTLTMTMNHATREQTGLALGVWGAVQATAAGLGMASGGLLRDAFGAIAESGRLGPELAQPATGYAFVYAVEIVLLIGTIIVMRLLTSEGTRSHVPQLPAMAARLGGE
jgi:BCD family chlorophyll transporter-like MFS transporter